ncbi:MAG TPA: diguanylate cyclase [Candidatus Saccharicenans sp.]|nr:diguanylate cyclase [Candidatus Saccharicenans sp.]
MEPPIKNESPTSPDAISNPSSPTTVNSSGSNPASSSSLADLALPPSPPRSQRSPIVLKFMLVSLPLLILACLALAILGPRLYRLSFLRNLQDKASSIGQIATYSLAPAIIFDDRDNMSEVLNSLSQIPEIDYILVFDASGQELVRYQRPLNQPTTPSSESASKIQPAPSTQVPLTSPSSTLPPLAELTRTALTSDGLYYNLYTGIEHEGEPVGSLSAGFSLKLIKAEMARINRVFLTTSLLIFAFGFLTIYFLSVLVTRPLRKMARTVNEIAAGNLNLRLEVTSSDEVGQLASIFNYGLDELQKTMSNLEEAKETLEKKVEERTAELQRQVEETEAIARKLRESEELFRSMVESLGEAVVIVDPDERFVFANPAARKIFNDTGQNLEGRSLEEFTTPLDFEYIRQQTLRRQQGFNDTYDLELTFPDGSKKAVIVNAAPRVDADGRFSGVLAVLTEITERKKQEKALAEAKDKLEKAIAELEQRNKDIVQLVEMGEAISLARSEKEAIDIIINYAEKLFSEDSGLFYLRPEKENFIELTSAWNLSQKIGPILNLEDCWALRKSSPHFVDPDTGAFLCPHFRDIVKLPARTACLPLISGGETIGLLAVICCSREEASDLLEFEARKSLLTVFSQRVASSLANIRLRESLRQQSIRDPLTGIFNRRYLEETLQREFSRARRLNQPLSIIMFDIDHFKAVNDSYGHEAGDVVLQSIARELQSIVRTEDIVCRFGGEEFVVVMPGMDFKKAAARASLILQAVRNLELLVGETKLIKITMSAGVASFPSHGKTPAEVLQAADQALFRAKKLGRDRAVEAEGQIDS